MPPIPKPCAVCALDSDDRYQVETMIDLGLSTTAISEKIRFLGGNVTPRQIESHKKHRVSTIIPEARMTVETPSSRRISEEGLTTDQMQQRLLNATLEAVDIIFNRFKITTDLRTARVFNELTATANNLINARMEREGLPETTMSVQITLGSLEEQLGLPETYFPDQNTKYQTKEN
jgi:hypothetical protein